MFEYIRQHIFIMIMLVVDYPQQLYRASQLGRDDIVRRDSTAEISSRTWYSRDCCLRQRAAVCVTGVCVHGLPIKKDIRTPHYQATSSEHWLIGIPSFIFTLLSEPGSPSIVFLPCGCACVWTMSQICVKRVCWRENSCKNIRH